MLKMSFAWYLGFLFPPTQSKQPSRNWGELRVISEFAAFLKLLRANEYLYRAKFLSRRRKPNRRVCGVLHVRLEDPAFLGG